VTEVHSGSIGVRLISERKKKKSQKKKLEDQGAENDNESVGDEGNDEEEGGDVSTVRRPFHCFALKSKLADQPVKDITHKYYCGTVHQCR
jgi:hypothetical protein